MVPQNDFLPFCPDDTGTNLLDEAGYLASSDRTSGNKPGIASAKLNNKALRQGTYIASQMAQYLSNQLGEDVLDDSTPARLLAQFMAVMKPYAPKLTKYTGSTGTWNATYLFFVASASATSGATYTNNSVTFTVVATISGATVLQATGAGDPSIATSGTLTKASGTGDSTITYYAWRKPIYIRYRLVGGGGGGSGNSAGGNGGNGGDTVFGVSTAGGGLGAVASGAVQGSGGTATLGSGPVGLAVSGGAGSGAGTANNGSGSGGGASSAIGGAGGGGTAGGTPSTGAANTGGGGGGGTGNGSAAGGAGGGSGAYVDVVFASPASTYSFSVGSQGAAGSGGGLSGGSGVILLEEHYQ